MFFIFQESSIDGIINYLKGRIFDGGTDLLGVLEKVSKYAMVLLFSDGVVTCGKEEWDNKVRILHCFSKE
jgi:hypothetical protein